MKSLILTTVVIFLFFPVLKAPYLITCNWEETAVLDDLFYGKIVKVEDNNDKEKVG